MDPSIIPPLAAPYLPYYKAASAKYNIPIPTLVAQDYVESGFNTAAISSAGAVGIAQFLPSTGAMYGLSYSQLYNPAAEIDAQAHYLNDLGYSRNPSQALEQYSGYTPGYADNVLGIAGQLTGYYGGTSANPNTPTPTPTPTPTAPLPSAGGVPYNPPKGVPGYIPNSNGGGSLGVNTQQPQPAAQGSFFGISIPSDIGLRATGVIVGIVVLLGAFILLKSDIIRTMVR